MLFKIYSLQIGNNKDAMRKTWNPKFTLRSHFDGIRALTFHPVEPVLVTASEDHTLKMWNLQKTAPAKKWVSLSLRRNGPPGLLRSQKRACFCPQERLFGRGTNLHVQGSQVKRQKKKKENLFLDQCKRKHGVLTDVFGQGGRIECGHEQQRRAVFQRRSWRDHPVLEHPQSQHWSLRLLR